MPNVNNGVNELKMLHNNESIQETTRDGGAFCLSAGFRFGPNGCVFLGSGGGAAGDLVILLVAAAAGCLQGAGAGKQTDMTSTKGGQIKSR